MEKTQNVVSEKLYQAIKSFVKKRVQNDEDVSDLVQEIFLKLHKNEGKIDDLENLVAWLYRVARNQIIDFYRKNGKPVPELPSEDITPTDDDIFREVSSWLEYFIDILSEPDQEILKLTEIKGLTQKEAALHLNISLEAAKARHQRAKRRLRNKLEECCAYTFDFRGKVISYEVKSENTCCD